MLREYIEQRSMPIPFAGCWIWLRSFGSHGYGTARTPITGGTTAHRVSYWAFKGPIPEGMLVQHSCDNKWCVNPDHLSLGTDKTNSDDKHRKGRANLESRQFGPHPKRKLTAEAVLRIRNGNEPIKALAAEMGVSARSVWAIRQGHHYREITNDNAPSATASAKTGTEG